MINSIFIFLAALFFVGQNQSGDARMGDPLTLRAIAAAVVGGIALAGGRGSVFFALIGALILSLVNKIIFFANIPYAYQTLVSGVIVIVAIASSQAYTLYSRKSMTRRGQARMNGTSVALAGFRTTADKQKKLIIAFLLIVFLFVPRAGDGIQLPEPRPDPPDDQAGQLHRPLRPLPDDRDGRRRGRPGPVGGLSRRP